MRITVVGFLVVASSCMSASGCFEDDCTKTLTCPSDDSVGGSGAGTSSTGGAGASTNSVGGSGGGGGGAGGHEPSYGATAVAAGDGHTCAIVAGGRVVCWGANDDGQLGNGTFMPSSTPVEVSNLDSVVQLALGSRHSCAVRADGSVWCWGDATFRQIGEATDAGVPISVPDVTNAAGVAAGAQHTCAYLNGGTAKCWGQGSSGQLGHGYNPHSSQPVAVDTLSSVSDLVGGADHSCAIDEQQAVYCWGSSGDVSSGNTPGLVFFVGSPGPPLSGSDLATTDTFACAVRVGKPWCWGTGYQADAVEVELTNVVRLDGSARHMCATIQNGNLHCWGENDGGQLGTGSAGGTIEAPTAVANLSGPVSSVAPGGRHTCALVQGAVWCWGGNDEGQLGNGSQQPSLAPSPVKYLP